MITQINDWINGRQDYTEGLNILREVTKKPQTYVRLLKRETSHNKMKLLHELKNARDRLQSIPGKHV
jgi:hypothetical protein